MCLIGVTGGIGAGKTAVLSEYGKLGLQTLDTDAVVHELYTPRTPVYRRLRDRWGQAVLDDRERIDRTALGRLVFAAPRELEWLEELVQPLVRERMLAAAEDAEPVLFCAVPLLFEKGWDPDMDCTIAVWCDPATQMQRLRERGWDPAQIRQRLHRQMDMDEKLARADYGIINIGLPRLLRDQCQRLWQQLACACRSGCPVDRNQS